MQSFATGFDLAANWEQHGQSCWRYGLERHNYSLKKWVKQVTAILILDPYLLNFLLHKRLFDLHFSQWLQTFLQV